MNNNELQTRACLKLPQSLYHQTSFWFEHNHPGEDLYVRVEVFSINGKLIKTLAQTINTTGNRSNEIMWDGRDEYGNKIGKGVYIYRLRVKTSSGKTADKWERLVILGK